MNSNMCFINELSTEINPDVTFIFGGKSPSLRAHRALLASYSKMLKDAFLSLDSDEAIILMPDFGPSDVSTLLNFLYGKRTEIQTSYSLISSLDLTSLASIEGVTSLHSNPVKCFQVSELSSTYYENYEKKGNTDSGSNIVVTKDDLGLIELDVDTYIAHEPKKPKPWLCQLCVNEEKEPVKQPFRSILKRNLKYHIVRKHFKLEVPKNWKCEMCGRQFISRSGLRQHKRDSCSKSFPTSSSSESRTPTPNEEVETTLKNSTGKLTSSFLECPKCSYLHADVRQLEAHLQSCKVVQNELLYQCNECYITGTELLFPNIAELRDHIDQTHIVSNFQAELQHQSGSIISRATVTSIGVGLGKNAAEDNSCQIQESSLSPPNETNISSACVIYTDEDNNITEVEESSQINGPPDIQAEVLLPIVEPHSSFTYVSKDSENNSKETKVNSPDVHESDVYSKDVLQSYEVNISTASVLTVEENGISQCEATGPDDALDSVVVEGLVESTNIILLDESNVGNADNPFIDTNEVMIRCESSLSGRSDVSSNRGFEDGTVFCCVCKNGFTSPKILAEHLKDHPSCTVCGITFLNSTILKEHTQEHPVCTLCGDQFKDEETLGKHEKSHADIEKALIGEDYRYMYQNPEVRDAISSIQSKPTTTLHKQQADDESSKGPQKHISKNRNVCQDLQSTLSQNSLVMSTTELEHSETNDFSREDDDDFKLIIAQQQILWQCRSCDKKFSSEEDLDLHSIDFHSEQNDIIKPAEFQLKVLESCRFCDQSFSAVSELDAHLKIAHVDKFNSGVLKACHPIEDLIPSEGSLNDPPISFTCNICKESFLKLGRLTKHINSIHIINKMENGKPFTCLNCGSNFLQLSTLSKHFDVQHRGQENVFVCPECRKSFQQKASLQQHLRIHSNTKLYQCSSCSRTFNWEASLRIHLKKCDGKKKEVKATTKNKLLIPEVDIEVSLESDSMQLKCNKCQEKFSSIDDLGDHFCTLGKSRPVRRYTCNRCCSRFKSRKLIRRHLKKCFVSAKETQAKIQRSSQRLRKIVQDDLYVADFDMNDKEPEDLVDSDAEEEFKVNEEECSSSDESLESLEDELDDFTVETDANSNKRVRNRKEVESKECHASTVKSYPCKSCGGETASSSDPDSVLSFCRDCRFVTRDSNKHSDRRLHSGKTEPKPTQGSKSFVSDGFSKDPDGVVTAQNTKEDSVPGPLLYNCAYCNVVSRDSVEFDIHLQSDDHKRLVSVKEFQSSRAKFKCEYCLFLANDDYKFQRHISTKKHSVNEEAYFKENSAESISERSKYSCLLCEAQFQDLSSLDIHVNTHKSTAEVKSRSGRKVKPNKFYDVFTPETKKRKIIEHNPTWKAKIPKRIEITGDDHTQGLVVRIDCGVCGETFSTHSAQFSHMLVHVPLEVFKNCSPIDGEEVGWCPYCPGPVTLKLVDEHISELHKDLEEEARDCGLKITEKNVKREDLEEAVSNELADSERCVPKRLPG